MKNAINNTLIIVFLTTLMTTSTVFADPNSPVGKWITIDDKTGKPRGIVDITEQNGVLNGRIVGNYPKAGEPENPICEKCTDVRKNKPIIGMTFLENMKKVGDEYTSGTILDPESGNIYSAKMKMLTGNKKMEVRGYLGISLLGRSQTWIRAEK
jgi:uncharacterized protein (DUF2147 family)